MTMSSPCTYLQVMVAIELPEFAVDDVEMFVRKVVCHIVDVLFVLQLGQNLLKNMLTKDICKHIHTFRFVF